MVVVDMPAGLSFAPDVETHGIGHAVDHFFEEPNGGPIAAT